MGENACPRISLGLRSARLSAAKSALSAKRRLPCPAYQDYASSFKDLGFLVEIHFINQHGKL